jgi:transcriptional regulator with XRE-family HTH domain
MTFGEKLKIARKKLMLSQEEMARELGTSFSTLNRWENAKHEPNYKQQRTFHEFCVKNKIEFKGEEQ